jgi:hypothetical protein
LIKLTFSMERDITLSMSKEIGKTRQFKQKKKGGNSKNNEKTQSNVILRFKPSNLNKTQISATFKDADKNEVKEYINIFQEGDPKENLVTLFKQVIDLGGLYNLWKSSFKTCAKSWQDLSVASLEKSGMQASYNAQGIIARNSLKCVKPPLPKLWARMLSEYTVIQLSNTSQSTRT